eukprot:UN01668
MGYLKFLKEHFHDQNNAKLIGQCPSFKPEQVPMCLLMNLFSDVEFYDKSSELSLYTEKAIERATQPDSLLVKNWYQKNKTKQDILKEKQSDILNKIRK